MEDQDARTSEMHVHLGRWMFEAGKYEEALHYLALALEPIEHPDAAKQAEAIFIRGMVRYASGDIHGAIEDYSHLIRCSPDQALTYHERALAYLRMGEKEKAYRDLQREMELGGVVCDELLAACRADNV